MHGVVGRVLLLCLAVLAFTTSPGYAAPGWGPAQPLGFALNAVGPRVVVDLTDRGSAMVAWRGTDDADQAILVAASATAGAFTPPVVVSRGGGDVGPPALAASDSGAAVVAWAQQDGGNWVVQASVRSSAGVWSVPEPLSQATSDERDPVAAISDAGEALVMWVGSGVYPQAIEASSRPPGGAWSARDYVERYSSTPPTEPHVVMDGAGNTTALWIAPSGAIATAVRPAGGSWTRTADLASSGIKPHLAAGANGHVAAVWQDAGVQAAVRPLGGPWGATETVGGLWSGSYPGERPQIALDGTGTATIVGGASGSGVQSSRRVAGSSWPSDAEWLGTAYYTDNYWPVIAANADGLTLISYLGVKDATPFGGGGTPIVHAALRQPGGGWTAPLNIASAGGVTDNGLDEAGDGLVGWVAPTGAVYTRAYDATPPRLLGLEIPATGMAERSESFAVSAQDTWSALGAISWDFGDGSSATGSSVTHRYASSGRYTVRVTTSDALGNATSAQHVIDVAPAPPRAAITDAWFARAAFRHSRVAGKARLVVEGTITAPLTASIQLVGPTRPRADERAVGLGKRKLDAGAFVSRFRIPKSVGSKMLPGVYHVRLTGPGLVPVATTTKLRAPRQGVVMAHRISTSREGPNLLRVTTTKSLWASFTFAPKARPRQKLRAIWYAPNSSDPVGSFPVERAISFWQNPRGLAAGRWRCVLQTRSGVVDSVSIRVG